MKKSDLILGIDIGSVSVKLAAIPRDPDPVLQDRLTGPAGFHAVSANGATVFISDYLRHQGDAPACIARVNRRLHEAGFAPEDIRCAVTGSGGRRFAEENGLFYMNGFRALAAGTGWLYPEVRTLFEMGGESSNYLRIRPSGPDRVQIVDYQTHGECAAGTGSFIDQQVERLRYRIEEVGPLILSTDKAANIAGRCSVFAKSDMIHAQQRGYSSAQILRGLCESVVRNFKGCIVRGKPIDPVVALVGGVAANAGIVQAFRSLFGFQDGELVVPQPHAWMGAIGAARWICTSVRPGEEPSLPPALSGASVSYPSGPPLSMEKVRLLRNEAPAVCLKEGCTVDAYLGIDVGSVSTNLALIDGEGNLIHGIYRMTEGRPVAVVADALKEMAQIVKDRVVVKGVGTTGSGRELIGILTGADVVKDEITCHRTGAEFIGRSRLGRQVDTIFEIGGQDSKFISIREGVVVDFSLNEACAAGTGSFLEEQANKLGIPIKEEFARLALSSRHPLQIGERCTVFMEKEMVPYLHRGVKKEDIVAGLACSVVHNYLNRVVKKRKIGDVIFFQGGTAYNDAVAAAFATVLDREIIVPPHNGILGAVGAALQASHHARPGRPTAFRGWDLSRVDWSLREFSCDGCANRCEIQEFTVEGEKSCWGDKCSDRFRKRARTERRPRIPDLFKMRQDILHGDPAPAEKRRPSRGRIGIPLALYAFDRLPFWRAYFETLGFEVVLSQKTHRETVHLGVEAAVAEPCFPVQVAHGHLRQLDSGDVDYLFLPNVVNEEDPTGSVASFICPWGQTAALVASESAAVSRRDRLLSPNIEFHRGREFVRSALIRQMDVLGCPASLHRKAVDSAYRADARFREMLRQETGPGIGRILEERLPSILLIGRPYNLHDPGLNLNIPSKLREFYGLDVIPMDLCPVDRIPIREIHDHMFWNFGRRMLQAVKWKRRYPFLRVICLSNFKCGPDSYIRHWLEEAAGEPILFLQLDSHSNDAGVMTRIEAFLESKGMMRVESEELKVKS
ncbi:MAG TPA: hypothetical protein ENN17_06835 [bacterium]|nr:hypothetical protein [bacterium]